MNNNAQWNITERNKDIPINELPKRNTIDLEQRIADEKIYSTHYESRRVRKKKKVKFQIPSAMVALVIAFIIMLGLLFIRSYIVSLNEDVRYLQNELDNINSEIDSKNGRLISNADLKSIESQARALGMTEASPTQYVYESAAKKQTVISDSPVGLYDYISFLVQIRNENLWPIEQ